MAQGFGRSTLHRGLAKVKVFKMVTKEGFRLDKTLNRMELFPLDNEKLRKIREGGNYFQIKSSVSKTLNLLCVC